MNLIHPTLSTLAQNQESLKASSTSSSQVPKKFSQLPNLHAFLISSLFNVLAVLALHPSLLLVDHRLSLTLSLTLCGLTGQKTHQGGPGLGGSVHEEAHPCFPYCAQRTFKSIYAGGFHRPLVQLIPPINYSIRKEIFTTVLCAPKFN